LIILCKDETYDTKLNMEQKTELFKWLDTLPILTIAIADNRCFGKQLELFLICDMRLGGINLQIEFPEDEDEFIYNLVERCRLVIGKGKSHYELLESRIINKFIDMNDIQNEVESYLNRIFGTKSLYHIKAIKKCFNNYKRLGISASQELLLEEESMQCATLIVDEYSRRGHKYEG
jgi:enoyl-CoA hydratase/carnithine racemase